MLHRQRKKSPRRSRRRRKPSPRRSRRRRKSPRRSRRRRKSPRRSRRRRKSPRRSRRRRKSPQRSRRRRKSPRRSRRRRKSLIILKGGAIEMIDLRQRKERERWARFQEAERRRSQKGKKARPIYRPLRRNEYSWSRKPNPNLQYKMNRSPAYSYLSVIPEHRSIVGAPRRKPNSLLTHRRLREIERRRRRRLIHMMDPE